MSMKLRKEYKDILEKLPIENPTPEDMVMVCPHLTMEQAIDAFNNDSGYIACPSLRIHNAFQIVSFTEASKNYPARLSLSYAGRTQQSPNYKHTTEAIAYAEKNWGEDLITDTWNDVVEIYIQDPSELDKRGYPTTKTYMFIALNREYNDIINDHSRPASELFDDAIVEMTVDPLIWHELKGNRGGYTDFNCAYCGSGMGLVGCSGCGHSYRDNYFRCEGRTPLSRKMVEFLRTNGHVFKKEPQIAWDREKEEWENHQKRR